MSSSPSPKRPAPSSKSSGAKILVTAASLAMLMGGWAALAIRQSMLNPQGNEDVSDDLVHSVLELPPIPTLVPEPRSITVSTRSNFNSSAPVVYSRLGKPIVSPPMVVVSTPASITTKQNNLEKAPSKPPKEPAAQTGSSR
jgi:hypothetical protein